MSQTTATAGPYFNSNLFSGHYLDERIQQRDEWDCDESAREAMETLQSLYEMERGLVEGYREDPLIDNWIAEVLDILGFGTNVETTLPGGGGFVDVLLFENTDARRDAASVYLDTKDTTDLFEGGLGLVEAKQWDANFNQRFSEQRPYRNASHQVKHYLERTPENIQWGILTNGRKWRLYGTKDYETQTYYEIDLPELLERGDLEAFKYFYVLFRPAAFRETAGTTFLDTVWSESETAAQDLGEDLQDNVFTALRVLGHGFVETNDLNINPDDEEGLAILKEQSLVLLYRLMFVLYAEGRGLIHPKGPQAKAEYEENFSLNALRLDIHDTIGEVDTGFEDEYSEYSRTMWSRLEDLFRLINNGNDSLGIPPYNGGLFDHEKHDFLTKHQVSNRYLAEVIYRLSTTETGNGKYVLADYADLDTRHLGSVYEGLLEHQFRIAPEQYAAVEEDNGQRWKPATEVTVADAVETVPKGGLYVVNDEGERKATGAYYTPDSVVTYIVEKTVSPLVEEIREDLIKQEFEPGTQEYLGSFLQRITDLKILDPAMGSGHFLTRATGYLAEQVMNEVREVEDELGGYWDEQHVRREIAKECIYGVDVNGMAVELAKLSMWLETLAADRPLAFLDHHLKTGNTLVGSDITAVLSSDSENNDGQLTLEQAFLQVRKSTLEHVMELMQDLLGIDNETLKDIRSMEEIYAKIRQDPLYQRLFELTNVHTTEQLGLDVPDNAYEQMAQAIEDEDEWARIRKEDWFRSAQMTSQEEVFFHWELEFPEVFFDENGRKRSNIGFDAVIGNPPWISFGLRDVGKLSNSEKEYITSNYYTAEYKISTFPLFMQKAIDLCRKGGRHSFITPDSFLLGMYFQNTRDYLLESTNITKLNLIMEDFWEDADVGRSVIYSLTVGTNQVQTEIGIADTLQEFAESNYPTDSVSQQYFQEQYRQQFRIIVDPIQRDIVEKIEDQPQVICDIGDFYSGCIGRYGQKTIKSKEKQNRYTIKDRDDNIIVEDKDASEHWEKLLPSGSNIDRYAIFWNNWYIYIHPDEEVRSKYAKSGFDLEMYEGPKLFVRQTGDSLVAAVDENKYFCLNNMHVLQLEDSSEYTLAAILNSKLLEFYYSTISLEKGRAMAQTDIDDLENLPVPSSEESSLESDCEDLVELNNDFSTETRQFLKWISRFWQVEIEDLSLKTHLKEYWKYNFNEILRIARKNKTKIERDIDSRDFQQKLEAEWESSIQTLENYQQEIDHLEARVSARVFELYGIHREEMEVILDNVEIEDTMKNKIVSEFNSIEDEI